MKILIANSTILHKKLEKDLAKKYKATILNKKEELESKIIKKVSPDYIFFLHWAYKIPAEIYDNYKCIVFHMTDLPFGRGGSPLQNLIVRGFENTKLSAIKVVEQFDAGDVYLKTKLSLKGTASQIFLRADKLIEKMIEQIIFKKIKPRPQTGDVTIFKRRTPEESNIGNLGNLEDVYDYIRMLDGEGYPKAFLETKELKFEFTRANFKSNNLSAYVRIIKK